MEKLSEKLIASTFEKVKDVDIFALKAYMEHTEGTGTGAQAVLLEVCVNFPFFLLNVVVGFFSTVLRFFENYSLYDSYKKTVYASSKSLWQNLSGKGDYGNSLLYVLIALSAFLLFISYLFSRGDFSKRLIHLFVVIFLGLGYFGTVQGTSGGLYLLDTVHELADSFSDSVTSLAIQNPDKKDKKFSHKVSVADTYIMETSYEAYLFVNTGQLNGKFHNNQTGKEENLDNEKLLGKFDKEGKFIQASSKDITEYTQYGDGALEGNEKNRWLSAVSDYLWMKSFYVLLKIVEAIILAIPLLLIQLVAFFADILVFIFMFLFPLALLVSLIPRMQHIIFNLLKVMFGAVSFPALAGFLTLIVFYIQALIASFIKKQFTIGNLETTSNLKGGALVFLLLITVVVQGVVFYLIWKYKLLLLQILLGSSASQVVNQSMDKVAEKASDLRGLPSSVYDRVQSIPSVSDYETPPTNRNAYEETIPDREEPIENLPKDDETSDKTDFLYEKEASKGDLDQEEKDFSHEEAIYESAFDSRDLYSEVTNQAIREEDSYNGEVYQKEPDEKEMTAFSQDSDSSKGNDNSIFQTELTDSPSRDNQGNNRLEPKSHILEELARLRGD